jgi:aspartyl/asparaginyl-tRNA synthetase
VGPEECGSEFLFVEGYPMAKRPFYTHPDPASPEFSASFDLLFRGLEPITGGQRLHRYEDYLAALAARGRAQEPFAGYLEAFRFGMPSARRLRDRAGAVRRTADGRRERPRDHTPPARSKPALA